MNIRIKILALFLFSMAKVSSATIIEKEVDYIKKVKTVDYAVMTYQSVQGSVFPELVDVDSFHPLDYRESGDIGCLKFMFRFKNGSHSKSYVIVKNSKPKVKINVSVNEFNTPFASAWQESCIGGMDNKIYEFIKSQ